MKQSQIDPQIKKKLPCKGPALLGLKSVIFYLWFLVNIKI